MRHHTLEAGYLTVMHVCPPCVPKNVMELDEKQRLVGADAPYKSRVSVSGYGRCRGDRLSSEVYYCRRNK